MATTTHPPRRRPVGFSAITHGRLSEEVAAQIRKLIWEGRLQPGDRLPGERELVERFQVSRNSVREAIRHLELLGLVRCRQGEGTIVREVSADTLTVPLSSVLLRQRGMVEELLEARDLIEPPIAARAAQHATPDQLRQLHEILDRQHAKLQRGELAQGEDTEFHYTIAVVARNTVVRKMVDLLIALLRESHSRALDSEGRNERSYAGHRRILRAIERRDPEGAERAMRVHLRGIRRLLLRSM